MTWWSIPQTPSSRRSARRSDRRSLKETSRPGINHLRIIPQVPPILTERELTGRRFPGSRIPDAPDHAQGRRRLATEKGQHPQVGSFYMNEAMFDLPDAGFVDRTVTNLVGTSPSGVDVLLVVERRPLPENKSLQQIAAEHGRDAMKRLFGYKVIFEREIEVGSRGPTRRPSTAAAWSGCSRSSARSPAWTTPSGPAASCSASITRSPWPHRRSRRVRRRAAGGTPPQVRH